MVYILYINPLVPNYSVVQITHRVLSHPSLRAVFQHFHIYSDHALLPNKVYVNILSPLPLLLLFLCRKTKY